MPLRGDDDSRPTHPPTADDDDDGGAAVAGDGPRLSPPPIEPSEVVIWPSIRLLTSVGPRLL